MTYQWKIPGIIPVDAQSAGDELDRIYQAHGRIEPADIVDESRADSAPLHPCFEWDDSVAAEKYRENQAGGILRAIVTTSTQENGQHEIRAFVRTSESYQPISVVMGDDVKMQDLLLCALKELNAFRNKYSNLVFLSEVFEAIDSISA